MTTPIHPQTLLDIIRKAEESVNARSEPANKHEGALAFFKRIVRKNPHNFLAHRFAGMTLNLQGKVDQAVLYFRKAIKADPYEPISYCLLGDTLEKQGKHDAAEAAYRKAVELDPKCARINAENGLIYLAIGDRRNAMRHYQKSADAGNKFAKGMVAYMKKHKPKRRT